ncbi:MAG: YhcH/YjgK/YiaL family protein [Bacteroidetes bacterium]|nr:YhcH/YjgK/YiaL family protein [Bacteroidota bacterium]
MIVDQLSASARYEAIHPYLKTAFSYLQSTDFSSMTPGKYPVLGDDIFAILSDYQTKNRDETKMEAHRIFTDIHFLISGEEWVGYLPNTGQVPSVPYHPEDDYMLFDERCAYTRLVPGQVAIFFPPELHMPSIHNGSPAPVRKVVMKLRLSFPL